MLASLEDRNNVDQAYVRLFELLRESGERNFPDVPIYRSDSGFNKKDLASRGKEISFKYHNQSFIVVELTSFIPVQCQRRAVNLRSSICNAVTSNSTFQ
jgi:hypothetical protein